MVTLENPYFHLPYLLWGLDNLGKGMGYGTTTTWIRVAGDVQK